ncbi:hypothetical protein AB0B01_22530 [Streptomyces sp. NPDC044571]|uniref:hypothetical protein n=1 Tax=Streptomyces sp. NPDC044571 TaxID=3155371 RepID=UPI003400747B
MLLGGVAGVLLTVVLMTVLFLMTVLWWPRTEVTYRSSAPSAIVYDRSPYFLALVHSYSLSGRDAYRLAIGRSPTPSYGHWVDVDTALGAGGIESTTWSDSGVRVRFPTGHELFVPARSFLGGR